MSLHTGVHSIRHGLRTLAILFLALLGLAGSTRAQEPAARGKIYVVTHVDVVPTEAASGTKLLKQYAEESRKDKGAVRVEVYIQISRINHFSVVEVWENRQALDAHEAAPHTKKFREQIDPLLGSPYDERLHAIAE
jgi:quinol monooxygenase YgiN